MDKTTSPNSSKESNWFFYSYIVVSIIALSLLGYFYYLEIEEVKHLQTVNDDLRSDLQDASSQISSLETELSRSRADRAEISNRYKQEKEKNDDFQEQLESLSGTIDTLDKLSKTDEELLQKYSRVYFLNENYRPEKLTQIDDEWVLEGKEDQYFHQEAWPHLEEMLQEAEDDGIDLKVLSAFRSFDEQNALKGQFTQQYGSGANTFSADQGYSEHQLGTTVDIVDPATGATSQSFADTEAYDWLLDNAHKYGFVLSYPQDNEYYIFEPWHWRFVGTKLARDLNRADAHFYDWDQREINQYLINLFD